jgi:hypothetical protein
MEAFKRTFGMLSVLLIACSALAQSSPTVSGVTAVPFRDLLLEIDLHNTFNATVVVPNCSKIRDGHELCDGYFRLEEKTEHGWETRLKRLQPGANEPLSTEWRPYVLANNKYGVNFFYEIPEVLRYGVKPGSLVRVVVYVYDPIYATTFPNNLGSLISKPRMEIVSAPFVVPAWE